MSLEPTVEDIRAAALARRYLLMRRRRSDLLGLHLFADPSWDMLLDLFVHWAGGVKVSVSSACLASGVPNTTALDHLRKLERTGLVWRSGDPQDRRRTNLCLSERTQEAIRRWIAETFVA